ncbi:hypothetical protein DY240_04585 [Jiangella rhizosphaerae]|uniref:Uncharacterized protein n=1 Tax=Jiangella rhizosphaerae TaxID=2293569 RepID=A0A418KWA8_9ACTN|nr:hypothetical protein DY240_04585 [Jiangella rhizosphaerae]
MSTAVMRAFVLTGPGEGSVQEVPPPVAAPGEVVAGRARRPGRLHRAVGHAEHPRHPRGGPRRPPAAVTPAVSGS